MAYKLDLKDKKLLYELDLNCRQSFSELAKKIKLSKNSVSYRINNLEKEGIIKLFHTIIDPGKLGYTSFRLYINLQNTTPEKEEEIINFLKSKEIVTWITAIEGNYNIGVLILSKSIKEVDELWRELNKEYINYLAESSWALFTKIFYFPKAYLTGSRNKGDGIIFASSPEKTEFDDTDIEILKMLAPNARIPIIDIASKLDLSPKTVISRIKSLEEKRIIAGYKAVLDLGKIGYQYFKVDFMLNNATSNDIDEFRKYIKSHPNIIYDNHALGGKDIEIEFHVESIENLREILKDIKSRFGKIIKDYSTMNFSKEYKYLLLPVKI